MGLSSELISQFAKTINASNKQNNKPSNTVYGKIVEYNGHKYAQLDGSDLLTPIDTTTSVKDGDRVTVKIENHTATVTGNLSDPSASTGNVDKVASQISEFEIIIAHKVSTEELEATNAYIENLKAISAKFDEMYAVTAEIEELQAKMATIDHLTATDIEAINAELENIRAQFGEFGSISTEDLEAVNAEIDNLKAYMGEFTYVSTDVLEAMKANIKHLDVEKLNANFANIDSANIDEAAIEKFYAVSGLIDKVVINNGKLTGELIGVTIKGDLVEAHTMKVDRLVIKGTDGNYYALSTDFSGITGVEPVEEDAIHGSVIVAKSVTATQIAVTDLTAFDATIAGFQITRKEIENEGSVGAIYSGAKSSVEASNIPGIYLDSQGQICVGDDGQFIKYYREENGNFRLDICADTIVFGSERKSVSDAINEVSDTLTHNIEEKNTQVIDRINSVDEDLQNKFAEFYGYIHIDPDEATITLGKSDNPIVLKVENDMIGFYKNDNRFGWWDGDDFYTGNVVVETDKRAQFGNFAFLPRHDGSLSLRKVADYIRFMIRTQPKDVTGYYDDYANYSVDAVGEGLRYKWQFTWSPDYIWFDISDSGMFPLSKGFDTPNLSFYCDSGFINSLEDPALGPPYKYIRCAITDASGETLYTREASLWVVPKNPVG